LFRFTDAAQKGSPETHTKFALAAREVGEVVVSFLIKLFLKKKNKEKKKKEKKRKKKKKEN